MRPNFLHAGVGKAGSNSIRSHLMDHPEIYFCRFLGVDDSFQFGDVLRRENRSEAPTFLWLQRQRRRFNADMHDRTLKFYGKTVVRRAIDRLNHLVPRLSIPPMSEEEAQYVWGVVRVEVSMLEELLDRDLSVGRRGREV